MKKTQAKQQGRERRHARIRAKVTGTAARPRLAIFRSNRYLYAQLINDEAGATIAAVDTRKLEGKTLTDRSVAAGKSLAEAAKKANIEAVVFDRGGFKYQGTIAAFADSARETGLAF